MKAIILAAGLGTRLLPLTKNKPKVLLPIGGDPILFHQLRWLRNFGIEEVCINLHHLGQQIKKSLIVQRELGAFKFHFNFEKEILGTAGALPPFKKILNETFFLIYGDVFHRVDLNKLLDFHRKKKGLITLVARITDHPEDSDLVERNADGKVLKFHPKPHLKLPKTRLSNTSAVYVVEPAIFDYIPEGFSNFDQEIIVSLIKQKKPIYAYLKSETEYIKDIGTHKRYQKAQEDFKFLISNS